LISKPCETCTILENKVKYILKTCIRFTKGKSNLEVVLGSQNFLFGKVGIFYNSFSKKKVKKFTIFFSTSKSSDMPFIVCIYCMRKGHVFKNCYVRKYEVSKGYLKWIPKGPGKD